MFNLGMPPQILDYDTWQEMYKNGDMIGSDIHDTKYLHYYCKDRLTGGGAEGICVSYDNGNIDYNFVNDSEIIFYAEENIYKIKLEKNEYN